MTTRGIVCSAHEVRGEDRNEITTFKTILYRWGEKPVVVMHTDSKGASEYANYWTRNQEHSKVQMIRVVETLVAQYHFGGNMPVSVVPQDSKESE